MRSSFAEVCGVLKSTCFGDGYTPCYRLVVVVVDYDFRFLLGEAKHMQIGNEKMDVYEKIAVLFCF